MGEDQVTYAPALPSSAWTLTGNQFLSKWRFVPASPSVRRLFEPSEAVGTAQPVLDSQPTDPWLGSAARRMEEIANLSQGWDDAAAPSIAPALLKAVTTFVSSDLIVNLPNRPAIVPTFSGGLLLEWHTEVVDLIIESAPDGEASFYFCDNETGDETEALLGDRSDVLTAAFVKLGLRS